MTRIGITGSFASGKSQLLNYLIQKGYPGFNCDHAVHELHNVPEIQKLILSNFPEMGYFNKQKLSEIIYKDPSKRTKLEGILHPLVAKKMEEFILNSRGNPIIFLEIPLLFEAKWEDYCDYIISLYCTKSVRIARALQRGISAEVFDAIDRSQLPENMKKSLADFTINTDCAFDQVALECDNIIESIL